MKSITRQKTFDEIKRLLTGFDRPFIIGCGTCTTLTRTGGIDQVIEMKGRLQELGKWVSGWTVIPTACDDMTEVCMKQNGKAIQDSSCVLAMTCALGVNRMTQYIDRPVIPALDTLFVAVEGTPGFFHEVCAQCGECILGETAGICPIATCHKGLVNGPCGGTNNGKCEVDKDSDCAWTLIYQRLKDQGRLELMRKYQPPRNYQVVARPRAIRVQ